MTESYSFKLAENLNQHIYDHDTDYLSSKLNLTPEEATLLLGFDMVSALSPNSQLMEEEDKIIVVIIVRVSDNAILPKLEKGIIQYLSTIDFVRQRDEVNSKYYESVMAAYDREIKMMDSLKFKISKGKYPFNKDGGTQFMDLGSLFETSGDLSEKKYAAERSLTLVKSIQVIEGLAPFSKPVWPRLSNVLITSVVLAGAIAGLLIIIMANRKSNTTTPA